MKLPTKKDIWKYVVLAAICLINIAEMYITMKYYYVVLHGWVFGAAAVAGLYMISLFPLLYGIFSRLLTRTTVFPTLFFLAIILICYLLQGIDFGIIKALFFYAGVVLLGSLLGMVAEWISKEFKKMIKAD